MYRLATNGEKADGKHKADFS